jgi:hypothetical protein
MCGLPERREPALITTGSRKPRRRPRIFSPMVEAARQLSTVAMDAFATAIPCRRGTIHFPPGTRSTDAASAAPSSQSEKAPAWDRLREVGLGDGLTLGDSVLPARLGPVSRFNAEGRWEVHRDRPKETVTRQSEWTWEQWAGRGLTETHSKIVDIPYQRYPRTFIPPPSVEISVAEDGAGREIVRAPEVAFLPGNEDALKHQVNLFLELFGECEVLSGDLEPRLAPELRRLNWRILPPGKHPWSRLRRELKPVLDEAKRGNRPVVSHRLEFLGGFDPEFAAVGLGGLVAIPSLASPRLKPSWLRVRTTAMPPISLARIGPACPK